MSKTVYIVTEGEYSAYRIEAVFLSQAAAVWYLLRFKDCDSDSPRIEEFEIGQPRELGNFGITMEPNGNVSQVDFDDDSSKDHFHKERNYYRFNVNAKDKKHAVKIANERRVQLIANNNEGIEIVGDFSKAIKGVIVSK